MFLDKEALQFLIDKNVITGYEEKPIEPPNGKWQSERLLIHFTCGISIGFEANATNDFVGILEVDRYE